MNWVKTDGGRAEAGFKGNTGDCAVRAMAVALGLDYQACYQELALAHKEKTGKKTCRQGIYKETLDKVLAKHGWTWHPAPKFDGRKARHHDMPQGVVIARMARHYAAVIDGVVHDSWDSTHKMIYGFWKETA
jgi:hypothetical protein